MNCAARCRFIEPGLLSTRSSAAGLSDRPPTLRPVTVTVCSNARPKTSQDYVGDHPEALELTASADTYDLAVEALRAQLPPDFILLGISSDRW